MNIQYIIQPDQQLGNLLADRLDTSPKRVVFVSAFVGLHTIMRIKEQTLDLKGSGSDIQFVLGIDLGGTSQEVLRELLQWNVRVLIVKHRRPGHTFHPKIYLFEWENNAEIIIGSNNITEGGFFNNYEVAVAIEYDLQNDATGFNATQRQLERFINPAGPTAYMLDEAFYKKLVANKEIPTEEEAAKRRNTANKLPGKQTKASGMQPPIFGVEDFEPPPALPSELLDRLVKGIRSRRRKARKKARATGTSRTTAAQQPPIDDNTTDPLAPTAFYMTLPTLQGGSIPGEARIPLEAIELAKEFWGWPDEYSKDISPRAGRRRVYWNWKPAWRVWSVEAPSSVAVQEVRMYMYENSSDFRFYVRSLVNAGGNLGDVVRIRRIAQPNAEYECVLARVGTSEYADWINYCTQPVRNSTRRFGYA